MVERLRSRKHPLLSLRECCFFSNRILGELGQSKLERKAVASLLGHRNEKSGLAGRKISSLSQFGMFRRSGGLYYASSLLKRISAPKSDDELRSALLESLETPPLFRRVLGVYRSQGRIPRRLANILVRDFGIAPKAGGTAATVLIRSAEYAGAIDSEGVFLPTLPRGRVPPEADLSLSPVGGTLDGRTPAIDPSGVRTIEVDLKENRKAVLFLPRSLTANDHRILTKEIELLALREAEGG
jgi:hypothetical protein